MLNKGKTRTRFPPSSLFQLPSKRNSIPSQSKAAMVNLPHDSIVDILARLPVKPLCRFRCVCNRWRTLISSPHFAKIHLSRSNNTHHRVILNSDSLYSINYEEPSDNGSLAAQKLTIRSAIMSCYKWCEVLGSCNGLLLVMYDSDMKFLINPSTTESKNIPNSPFGFNPDSSCSNIYGLGFDCSINDFKVVKISHYEDEVAGSKSILSVYTLKTGFWRRIQDWPYDHCFSFPIAGVLVNGALHWFLVKGRNASLVIVCFDIVKEAFQAILPPPCFEKENVLQYELGVLGGCLCVTVDHYRDYFDVWVMKEYGESDSWNKFKIAVPCASLKPLCFLENSEILMLLDITEVKWVDGTVLNDKKLLIYKIKEETYRYVVIDGIRDYVESGTYAESLISPYGDACEDPRSSRPRSFTG